MIRVVGNSLSQRSVYLLDTNKTKTSMSTSSFSSQLWNYDVFLSFRGEDTRKTFVDHLYKALVQQNIFTYKDDKTLVRGESIAPALLEAISLSGISVIVFSENYANSSWCLDELAHIMKCRDEIGTIVMPIFYHVDPSNVRKQKGKYGEAFAKHEFENNKNVESWRKALFEAGNIAGWEIKHVADGHESKEIKEIVNTISNRLFPLIPNVNERLIGIKSRFQDLESHLEIGLGGVSMVGIWGVGGGGKTTLASYVYNEISSNFVGCYFVENIRDESRKYGLEKLQTKLICNVLKQKHAEVGSVEEGRQMIKSELCTKKVLIVLDDVNHLDHLKALAGSHDWFGDGSRIIITTRDNDLLYAHKVDVIHKISLLDNKEDIKLFRKHAPQNYRPREDYDHLSKQVVSYAGGLPLALIVLSSFLCDKDMDEWRSAMERLKDIPETDIIKKLKISFDGLKQIEQELFLDIACLFVGEKKKDAMESLDACGFHSRIGVKVLLQKALVNINSDGKFDMHDLLQEMGHYIVRGEHPRNPEKHSRVWQVDDVTNICSMDDIDATTEFNKIEAIQIYSDMHDPLPHHNHHAVTNMKKLRWIDWRGHHASSLPKDFPQRELRCLILIKGHHKQLWNGYKHLPNLMMIKLHNLNNLTLTPDFSGLPNLERFVLNRSPCLEEIHESIGGLERLVFLLITGCNNLKMFPSITGIKNLETLSLSKCSKLITKSKKEVASYKQYSTNNFVTRLLPTLKESSLFLMGMNPTWSLQFISGGLKRLNLSNCHLGDEDIDSNVWELPNLQELDLSVNIFTRLSFRLLQLPRLKWLDVSSCNKLEVLFALPSSIAVLRADYCYSLDTLGDLSNCKWLWKVSFFGKNKLWPIDDVMLLDSMCQGYAIEHHFMSLALEHQVRKLYESSVVGQRRFILELPHNWCNDFSGFLIHCVIEYQEPYVTIIIKQEQQDEIECNYKNELFSNPPPPPTYIGYVSFSSLMRHATWLNSACNMISFTLGGKFSVKLVPRKSIGDNSVPESDWYFWDEEREDRKTFTIQRESKSSINILWSPC